MTMPRKKLGPIVKAARYSMDMTQRDLAAAVGIKASHVAYIENGRRKPSISLIVRLAKTLRLDGKELLVLAQPEVKQIIEGRADFPKRK
jgi:transcriptional regulator with XRE-family HTH domain